MINNLPSGWKEEKIGNIINLTIGKTPSRKKTEYFTGDNLWVSIADIKSINLTDTKEKITEQAIKESNIKKVKAGTLIMSYKLSIGKMAFASQDLYTNEAIAALNIEIEDLDKKFLYYYLLNADLEKTTDRAVKGKTLNKAKIEQIPIQFPPLQQQEKIVKVLDTTSNLIEKQKELLKNYDLFLKSKFIEMFGDPIKNPMGWKTNQIKNGVKKVKNDNPLKQPQKTYIYIDIGSLNNKYIENYNYILGEDAPSRAKQITFFNDILVSTVRPNLNNVAMVKSTYETILSSTGFCILRTNEQIFNPYYLFEVVKHQGFIQSLINVAKGASYPAVSNNDILDLKITVPPIELQNKFASIVEKIETIKEKENQKLKQLEDLHNSSMQRAFKGEIE